MRSKDLMPVFYAFDRPGTGASYRYQEDMGPHRVGRRFTPYKCFRRRGKPWRRGNSFAPSILISPGIHKNSHTFRCGYFYGGGGGSRTLVEAFSSLFLYYLQSIVPQRKARFCLLFLFISFPTKNRAIYPAISTKYLPNCICRAFVVKLHQDNGYIRIHRFSVGIQRY